MTAQLQVLNFPSELDFEATSLESEDGMAPKVDRLAEINKRIDSLRDEIHAISKPPSWPVRLYQWAVNHKSLSIVLCLASIFGGGYFKYWLDHRPDSFNGSVDAELGKVLDKSGGVNATLKEVRDTTNRTQATLSALQPFIQDIINHQFENVSHLDPQALLKRMPAVKNLLTAAKEQHVQVNPKIITKAGQEFVEASNRNQEAWDIALGFLNYKSANSSGPSYPPTVQENLTTHYDWQVPPGMKPPSFAYYGWVPIDSAAQFDFIGRDENKSLSLGNAGLIVAGGGLVLDGMQIKNVELKNVEIHYSGGPILLTNVFFIYCTFKMVSAKNSRDLATAILAPTSSTTFNTATHS